MKGQVTIYTTAGCPYCLHAKQTLQENDISYKQISLDRYSSDIRDWLKERTNKSSVPQIFFNNYHLGGNDELQSAIKDPSEWEKLLGILNEDLEVLDLRIPSPSSEYKDNEEYTYERDASADIVKRFMESGIPRKIRPSFLSSGLNGAFSGLDFTQWFCRTEDAESREATTQGSLLLKKKFILPFVQHSNEFQSERNVYYRLNDITDSPVLNAGPEEGWCVPDAGLLGEALRQKILALYEKHLSPDGKSVDYLSMKNADEFQHYVGISRLLNRVRLGDRSEDERKAFFINVYNALVIHATVARGAPKNFVSRLMFYAKMSYSIGGYSFTLNDIENGVLRANRKGVFYLQPPLTKSDPRRPLALTKVDPRIHFALNCGAKSCPPIKTYTTEDVDKELQTAAESYLESDEGVVVGQADSRSVTPIKVSSLLKWYATDFGSNSSEILDWIVSVLPSSSKKDQINELRIHGRWKLSYLPYNWDVNSA